jgi:hypothetical protein
VEIRRNLGGLRINSSTDASAQSVVWTQPNMLAQATRQLHGLAKTERSALSHMVCTPVRGDIYMVCSITGENETAVRDALDQAAKVIVSTASRVLLQGDALIVEEHQLGQSQIRQRDTDLRRQISRMIELPAGSPGRSKLAFDRSALRIDHSILKGNRSVIASLHRQEAHIRDSFVLPQSGSVVKQVGGSTWPVAGGIFGAAAGFGLSFVVMRRGITAG